MVLVLKNIVQCMLIKLTLKFSIKLLNLANLKWETMLGWAVMIFHILQASALNINWHSVSCSSHFLPKGTDLISYCYTFLISKRFSYLLSQYLKWRHWMATAKLDPVHTAIKLHKICKIKIIARKTKNFQASCNIIMNFNHQ